jgi:hypothetical protein
MGLVEALSKSYGFRYLVFWGPSIYVGNKPFTQEELAIKRKAELNPPGLGQLFRDTFALIDKAGDKHIVDLADVYDGTREEIYMDPAHVNLPGQRLLADRIVDSLRKSDTGSAPSPQSYESR